MLATGYLQLFLAAGLEAAAVGDRDAEVFVGIDRSVVDANFVVEVRSGGASAEANVADGVAAMNLLAGCDRETGKVAVAGGDAVAMIHHDELAVSAEEVRESDYAIGGRDDRVAVGAADIHAAVKRALAVERIDALPKAGGDLAIDRPKVGSGVGAVLVRGGGVAGHAQADANRGGAGEGGSAQRAQLIERRSDIGILNLLLRGCNQGRLRFQSVKRGNLTGNRTQRSDLHVALFGHFFQPRIAIFELLFFGAQFVVVGNLEQHARIRGGDAGEAEKSDGSADYEYIQVMDRNGDLAQLPVVAAGHEKYVEALLQLPSFFTLCNDQGRNSRQSSEVAESLFGQPDCFGLRFPILGMEISNVPFSLTNRTA